MKNVNNVTGTNNLSSPSESDSVSSVLKKRTGELKSKSDTPSAKISTDSDIEQYISPKAKAFTEDLIKQSTIKSTKSSDAFMEKLIKSSTEK